MGSILPDIDEAHSKISRWGGIIGSIISKLAKHRGIFHSLTFAIFLFAIISLFWKVNYALALFIGYISHLVADGLTKMGVELFYPFSNFKLKGPVITGGILELLLFILSAAIIIKILI